MKRTIYAMAISLILISSAIGFLTSCVASRSRTRQSTRVEERTENRVERRHGDD